MKKLFLTLIALVILAGNFSAWAQRANYQIIPLPKQVEVDDTQTFTLQSGMGIAFDASNPEILRNAQFLRDWVEQSTGIKLLTTPNDQKAAIRLVISMNADSKTKKNKKTEEPLELSEQQQEAYKIKVGAEGIAIYAHNPIGFYRAAQTLRKALPIVKEGAEIKVELPYVNIQDEPRFVYRGVLLDCARHFFSVEMIKEFLDVMALHGCNQFHWHLTDDQGWRFEVKSMPELALRGSVREQTTIGPNVGIFDGVPHGGYYTQEECRDIVKYAAERYINVIPEIDLPGHMQSALHVYPELGCTGGPYPVRTYWGVSREVLCGGNPKTLEFLKNVLKEVCEVFPSKIIHIGGDECPKDRWKACPTCQAKIKELGLKDDGKHSPENQLQSYINKEIEAFMAEQGRDIIGWDEILEGGLSGKSIVMSWRGTKGGTEAAKQGHRVIMSPNVFSYIDHPQLKDVAKQPRTTGSYIVSASKVYSFEPLLPDALDEQQQKYILGSQVNLWSEHVAYPEHAFYQLLPRLGAASEVQWCRPEQKDFESFKQRLPQLKKLYDLLGVSYCTGLE